jgi:Leucine-rich repeat (LRR) protein
LEELDCSNNQLQELPASFASLNRLQSINITGTPLYDSVPREIKERGPRAVLQWLQQVTWRTQVQ